MSRTAVQKKSDAQEKRTATTYGGSRTPMSGAGWKRKADVRTDDFLIENKTKMKATAKSYSLKADELRKLQLQALQEDRIPLFQVDLGGRSYVILVEDDFLDLIGDQDDQS